MAEQWGIAPWELEDALPCMWADRWVALQQARARAAKGPALAGAGKAG